MSKTSEMVQYLVEQRLTGYSMQKIKEGIASSDEELKAIEEWNEVLDEVETRIKNKLMKVHECFLEAKDKELEEIYLFGLKDGISVMKHIREIRQ